MPKIATGSLLAPLKAMCNKGVRVCVKDAFSLPGAALAAALAFLCVGCGSGSSGDEADRLNDSWALWSSTGISHYAFTRRRRCFCLPEYVRPVRIEVNDGSVVSIKYADDGKPADPAIYTEFDTVDDLFEQIEVAIEDDDAVLTSVTYDATLGYLKTAVIDWRPEAADDEVSYTVSDLEAIPELF